MEPSYVEGQTFSKIDFATTPMEKGEYDNCVFSNCNFANADLTEIKFLDTEFIDCNFSNANISMTAFQEITFRDCKMIGLQFEKCNAFGFAASFENCLLNHCTFYQMKLNRSSFINCQLQGVDFVEADLKSGKIVNCDLLNATFENTNLEKADLRNSINYSINPEINRVKNAKFSLPDVIGLLDKYELDIDQNSN